MVKTLSELYLDSRRKLMTQEDPQTAGLYARNVLCNITGKTQEAILADGKLYVGEDICHAVEEAVAQLLAGKPLAYVLGQWDFYGLTLYVDENVLIPRDDTCAVVDLALKWAQDLASSPRILDLCTGSGCIGLAIASRIPDAKVTLADLSRDAIKVAKKNIAGLKMGNRVTCIQANALDFPPAFMGKFDMIVSNPPYITAEEMLELPVEVKDHEPHLALYGGADGLDFYRAITDHYRNALKHGGYLCFEYGMWQGDGVCEILEMNGYTILERTRDNNHIERAVIAQYGRKEK